MRDVWAVAVVAVVVALLVGFAGCTSDGATGEAIFKGKVSKVGTSSSLKGSTTASKCGNGILERGELCDTGSSRTAFCSQDCKAKDSNGPSVVNQNQAGAGACTDRRGIHTDACKGSVLTHYTLARTDRFGNPYTGVGAIYSSRCELDTYDCSTRGDDRPSCYDGACRVPQASPTFLTLTKKR